MYKISFIVPVYNVELYIEQCIISLLAQANSNNDIEIILVDDGSSDNSLDICLKYEKEYDNIKVFHQANSGANMARNLGLEKSSGEWVCFVDGDDWVSVDLYDSLYDQLCKDWEIVIYSYNKVYSNKKKPYNSKLNYLEIRDNDFELMQLATLNRLKPGKYDASVLDVVSIWNKLYKKEFLLRNNLKFIANMPKLQDLTFNLRVYEYARKAVYVNKELYNYRINSESVSHRYQKDIIQKFAIINDNIYEFVIKKNNQLFENAYNERMVNHLRTIIVLYLCNRKNKKSYAARKVEFKNLLNTEPYKTALVKADLSQLPFKEKILSIAIKYKQFFVCELLNILENAMK